jgi:hypothetical protein
MPKQLVTLPDGSKDEMYVLDQELATTALSEAEKRFKNYRVLGPTQGGVDLVVEKSMAWAEPMTTLLVDSCELELDDKQKAFIHGFLAWVHMLGKGGS